MKDLLKPYRCKNCNCKFDINFWTDIILCPKCGSENIVFLGEDL